MRIRAGFGLAMAAAVAAALALSGCGRRGALEPPPNGAALSPDRAEWAKPPPNPPPPDRPFPLDPLI